MFIRYTLIIIWELFPNVGVGPPHFWAPIITKKISLYTSDMISFDQL